MSYDIIGDIHGCAQTLTALLEQLGYTKTNTHYHHPTRKVVFLGDFVDRGPYQREVIKIVRDMMDAGSALSVMGNHEFNAIAYATFNEQKDDYLRSHSTKNQQQHQAFLDAYENDPDEYAEVINWFKTLPLWLELDGLNIVHACWDKALMDKLNSNTLNDDLLIESSTTDTWQYDAIETLLKGKEIPLKEGQHFYDKDGHIRHNIRVRWWDQTATTYKQAFMGPESALTHIPDDEIEGDHLIDYHHDLPPVFLGHYWMEGEIKPLAKNIACVDFSVAKSGGKLVAYQWDGEKILSKDKFMMVDRIDA